MSGNWLDSVWESLYLRNTEDPLPAEKFDAYRVLAAVATVPRQIQFVGGVKIELQGGVEQTSTIAADAKPIDITMPGGIFETRFSEPNRERGFWRLYLAAKRIRGHVSYHCEMGVPMVYLFVGPKLMFPFKQFGDLDRVLPYQGTADPVEIEKWRIVTESNLEKARTSLRRFSPGKEIDHAIRLVGDGLVQEDIEESFSFLWRAVERIAKMDLRRARSLVQSGDFEAGLDYAKRLIPGLINSQPKTLEINDAVVVSVAHRVPDYGGPPIDEMYSLRSSIMHDNPTPEQVQRIAELRSELFQLAKRVISSAIAEVPA